ncbi:MAG: hypothetical protein EOO41_00020 [Methanobacteriota archaeon]|nr:MAG: hypothetical protein EOO41_00020 [Euryarchaeota archaeon]
MGSPGSAGATRGGAEETDVLRSLPAARAPARRQRAGMLASRRASDASAVEDVAVHFATASRTGRQRRCCTLCGTRAPSAWFDIVGVAYSSMSAPLDVPLYCNGCKDIALALLD